jgi:hypothetical protein
MSMAKPYTAFVIPSCLQLALRVISLPRSNWVALGAEADIEWQARPAGSVANDPKRTFEPIRTT